MKVLEVYKVILWDFDGVIMDSMPVRDKGFMEVLKSFPAVQVDELMKFHRNNGGLSRYVKFRYFFEEIRKESITEEEIMHLSTAFSAIMLSLLINEKLIIEDSFSFIKEQYERFNMHVVSGSDERELKIICNDLNLTQYFKSIKGSPIPKNNLVNTVIQEYGYNRNSVVLIGDSKNDYEAAKINGIDFCGYNNLELKPLSKSYINSFDNL